MAEALKTFSFPVGGIADFYLEDHEKEALYKEKAQENFGSDGLGAIQDVAVRMASYGRYGDDKLVHAETGELVVPKALIDKNPKLKESIFGHLKDMGIEDPERYVVGTEANSINPDTGLPEFFLKDIFDKVGDVIRKVAKPVLTIAGTAFFGPIYGAALGAGIGGLIQGESLEQAFGSALTAGATGGALSFLGGAGSALVKGENILSGGVGALQEAANLSNITQGFSEPFYKRAMAGPAETEPSVGATGEAASSTAAQGAGEQSAFSKLMTGERPTQDIISKVRADAYKSTADSLAANAPKGLDPSTLAKAQFEQGTAAANLAEANLQPSLLRQYGPSAALATTTAAAGGFFDAPEVEEMDKLKIGQDLIDENRGKYIVQGTDIIGSQPPFMVPTRFQFTPTPPVQYAADGGEAKEFPRRNGGIGMDEGTPGKDSVRAMLMPGEFVMTTDAVNGAGDGDNEKGIQNMYAMMRNFEAKARA
jgi:hypothetical protein